MKACAIVPSHNHDRVIGAVIARLRAADLPVFVIDDGSAEPARSGLAALGDAAAGIVVHRLEPNQGKGAAVMEGFRLAAAAGFTHAVQVDADGQHDLEALPGMLDLAARRPAAAICGHPVFDGSVPLARRLGHGFSNFWIRLETLSSRISDGMCGFRVYPLAAVNAVMASESVGRRMDFDIDIIVRLYWRGTPVVMVPVKVVYPPGNRSNFALVADNWRIARMHARLLATMLSRLPSILAQRPPPTESAPSHWSALRERGAFWGLRACGLVYRALGRRGCRLLLHPIVFYYYALAAGGEQRRASLGFLARALGRPVGWADGYRHYLSFARRALDTFAAWNGGIGADAIDVADREVLDRAIAAPGGALIVVAHVGNLDLARAVLDARTRERLTVLVHTRNAVHYNRILREFRPEVALKTIQVTEIEPAVAIDLKQRVERGEWVVIAGDRTPVANAGRVVMVPFFGQPAAFSQGPWVLASLLECPVYMMFCLRAGTRYRLSMESFADRVVLPRADRASALRDCAARFAARLEHYARLDPFQWYNFYDFWAQ